MTNTFCDACGVSLDLHPSGEQIEDSWECDVAAQRAALINTFFAPPVREY